MEPVTCLLLAAVGVLCLVALKTIIYKTGQTNIPGPKPWPIIGNAGFFYGVDNCEKAFKAFKVMAESHDGPLSRVWLGPKLCILVKDPAYMESLMNHKRLIDKDNFFYQCARDAYGVGVLTRSTTEGWHQLRKPLGNFVLPKNIPNFQYTICQKIDEILNTELDKHVDKEAFKFSVYIKACNLEILLMATLGMESLDLVTKDKFELVNKYDRESERNFSLIWSFGYLLGLKATSTEECQRNLENVPCKIMDEMKNRLKEQRRDFMAEKPENYADVLFRFGKEKNMSETEVGILLSDYLIAGSDTQSVAATTTLTHLALNQECQAKVAQELYGIFGDSTRDANMDDLKRMEYLEMCIKEALRFSSPPAVFRLAEEDIDIEGYIIPKGSAVAFTLCTILKDPRYWERPEEFYPEHFHPEAVAARPKGAFLPFAAGPKNCPGQAYGYQSMKTIVSTLIRRYHWTTDMKCNELEYKYLLMREISEPSVKLTRRMWPTRHNTG